MLNDVTVFDFETSGLDPENDRVIEMAAIRIRGGQIVGEFSVIVNHPDIEELPDKITEITGITTAMMRSGMQERMAFQILNRMMMGGDTLLVAHNAAFDLAFLHFSLQRLAGRSFSNRFIDTLTICRERHTYPHKLENMCERYGIALNDAHRALNDVYGCWNLLQRMHEEEAVDVFLNRLGYLRKYGPPQWSPPHAELFVTDNRYDNKRIS